MMSPACHQGPTTGARGPTTDPPVGLSGQPPSRVIPGRPLAPPAVAAPGVPRQWARAPRPTGASTDGHSQDPVVALPDSSERPSGHRVPLPRPASPRPQRRWTPVLMRKRPRASDEERGAPWPTELPSVGLRKPPPDARGLLDVPTPQGGRPPDRTRRPEVSPGRAAPSGPSRTTCSSTLPASPRRSPPRRRRPSGSPRRM